MTTEETLRKLDLLIENKGGCYNLNACNDCPINEEVTNSNNSNDCNESKALKLAIKKKHELEQAIKKLKYLENLC